MWGGHDLRLDRPVAVKVLASIAGEHAVRQRFELEARTAARLVHPNVVGVFDVGEERGRPFIVMERLSGRTLGDELAAKPLPAHAVRKLGMDVAAALRAAHAAGIVHCDVKPANILADAGGNWKVSDFGIARSLDTLSADLTAPGLLVGTPAYLAPELVAGRPATPTVDVYALGAVLYEALSGRKPFEAPTAVAMLSRIASGRPPSLRLECPDADPELVAIIERAMQRAPERRFASAAQLHDALAGVRVRGPDPAPAVRTRGIDDTQTMRWPPVVGARLLRRRLTALLIACVAALVGIVMIGAAVHGATTPPTATRQGVTPPAGSRSAGSVTTTPTTVASSPSTLLPGAPAAQGDGGGADARAGDGGD